VITIDFETRSTVDLRKCGTSVYARHASTEILCLAYCFGNEPVRLWMPGGDDPAALLDAVSWGVELIEAHNVFFERNIWRWICHERMGWPDVKSENWRCSMAACCRLTLPRSLDEAGAALSTAQRKDAEGHKLMMRLSKPRKPTKTDPSLWDNDPEKLQKLYSYCKQDVRAEREISHRIEPLAGAELKLWQIDQRINLRGLCVDRNALKNALAIVDQTYAECCETVEMLTQGKIKTPKQVAAILGFIESQTGERPENLSAEVVSNWLGRDDIPLLVRRVLEIRQEASKASTAKIKAMLDRCDGDGRVRGNLVYHGAATGRWAGSGIQIQNFPRGGLSVEEIEIVHRLLPRRSGKTLDLLLGPPIECISSSLRSVIRAAPGNRLLVCDFASIEARVLAWIAQQGDLLDVFVRNGDVYKAMAAKIYDKDEKEITKQERQLGKVAILGLGYGMGWKAFVGTCHRMAGVTIDAKTSKRVVKIYRDANSKIKEFWGSLGTACIRSIETQEPHRVGRLSITCEANCLKIKLPSGRCLHYRDPSLRDVIAPWSVGYKGSVFGPASLLPELEALGVDVGNDHDEELGGWSDCDVPARVNHKLAALGIKAALKKKELKYIKQIEFKGVDPLTKKWTTLKTYGAQLVENVVQAIARDFLAEALFRCEKAGYEAVATVHDEIVCERKMEEGSLIEFENLIREVPRWGLGCPIEVEGFESMRYRK
jgi:DNA polymerase bacteriophage-type